MACLLLFLLLLLHPAVVGAVAVAAVVVGVVAIAFIVAVSLDIF